MKLADSNSLRLIMLVVAIAAISGCVSTGNPDAPHASTGNPITPHQPDCGKSSQNGRITVKKRAFASGGMSSGTNYSVTSCSIDMTYKNTSDRTVKPLIEAILFDEKGDAIGESSTIFLNIAPGESQARLNMAACNGRNISKMHIKTAYNISDKSKLCGVQNKEVIFY